MRPDSGIFRSYDIRGDASTQLTEEVMAQIGRSFAGILWEKTSHPQVCVAHDGRESSPRLAGALVESLRCAGVDVIFLGLGSTPFLYWSEYQLEVSGALMVTGSHNPPKDNGLKMTLGRKPFFGEAIQDLFRRIHTPPPSQDMGRLETPSLLSAYGQSFLSSPGSWGSRPLKVVWDPGNGAVGAFLRQVTEALPIDSVILHEDVNGAFPARSPDPTKTGALSVLKQTVLETGADLGVAFDGDGDRLVCMDDQGSVWSGDELLVFFAEKLHQTFPDLLVCADIKVSPFLCARLESQGIQVAVGRTGHVYLKNSMKELSSLLGGEVSGHFFFRDAYAGFDDGLYAALRLIQLLSHQNAPLSSWYQTLPKRYKSGEQRVPCPDQQKPFVMEALYQAFSQRGEKICTLDGMKVICDDAWWLIRPSHTEQMLVIRWESETIERFLDLKKIIFSELREFNTVIE